MVNKELVAKKTERAKCIVRASIDIAPPLWCIIWLKKHW